jgi:hypothetical protein
LDVDTKHDSPGLATLERLRRAGLLPGPQRLVATPSGGLHLYFTGSAQRGHTKARFGIDTRAVGGYVVAPPSTFEGRPYRVMEVRQATGQLDWARIIRFLEPPRPQQRPRSTQQPGRGGIDGLVRFVEQLPAGNRNNGLFWAACRAVEAGHNPDGLGLLLDAACRAGLTETEARRTIGSAQQHTPRGDRPGG